MILIVLEISRSCSEYHAAASGSQYVIQLYSYWTDESTDIVWITLEVRQLALSHCCAPDFDCPSLIALRWRRADQSRGRRLNECSTHRGALYLDVLVPDRLRVAILSPAQTTRDVPVTPEDRSR
jgi:hypothetical protein